MEEEAGKLSFEESRVVLMEVQIHLNMKLVEEGRR